MDEARANNLVVDPRGLAHDLGVAVVPCAARSGEGIDQLLAEIDAVATGGFKPRPYRLRLEVPGLREAVDEIAGRLRAEFPDIANAEWVALRLLEGDRAVAEMVERGTIGRLDTEHAAAATGGRAMSAVIAGGMSR